MQYRRLGHSDLNVSILGMGTDGFTGGTDSPLGAIDVPDARRLVAQCLDAGINLLDTADVYNDGVAEEILGEVLVGRRDKAVVATKLRFSVGTGPNDQGLSRDYIVRSAEASLRRLKTDRVDLYQMHGWDGQTPVEESLEAFDTLIRAGKVRYIGASISRIEKVSREPLPYPYWHQAKTIRSRMSAGDAALHLGRS